MNASNYERHDLNQPFSTQVVGTIAKCHFHTSTQTSINLTKKDALFCLNQITTKLSHELEACLTAILISTRAAWTLSLSLCSHTFVLLRLLVLHDSHPWNLLSWREGYD